MSQSVAVINSRCIRMRVTLAELCDNYLATEMLEFNVFTQFNIVLFIYQGGWPCDLCQSQSIHDQGHKLKAKAGQFQGQCQGNWP